MNIFRRRVFCRLAVVSAIAALLSSCGKEADDAEASGPYTVSATIGMIADVVSEIGGERVKVETLIGPGVDPHLYKPTSTDVKALQSADIVFYNGLLLEGKLTGVLEKLAASGKPVHAVTETILAKQKDRLLPGDEYDYDPHLWMNVEIWAIAAETIAKKLTAHDPDGAETYAANLAAYDANLNTLHEYAQKSLSTIPDEKATLVTAHDAFGYLSSGYGIPVWGLQGLSTESEAGLRDIEELVKFLVEQKIPAIFVESTISDKNMRALVEGAERQGHTVAIGGELFSDAMGPAGTYEGTYIGMIDHNVTTIARALGGEAPKGGLNGKLTH